MNTLHQLSSQRIDKIIDICAGVSLCLIYGFLALKSNIDHGMELLDFLGSYWFAAAVLLFYWIHLQGKGREISFQSLFLWAIVFRVIGVVGSPVLEDDFYRYLLDGCVFVSSGSPYGIAPESLFSGNTLTPECQAALNWVNNPDLPTIYGPVLQYLFALSHIISAADINFLQLVLVLFDLALIYLLRNLAKPNFLLLYAWCPLILKEIAFTAHPDIVGTLFLVAAFLARRQSNFLAAAVLIGLACGAKIFAFLALPYFLFRNKLRYCLISLGTILVLYLPFMFQGQTDVLVVGIFAERWEFNPIVFEVLSRFLPDLSARMICLLGFMFWWTFYFYRYHQNQKHNNTPTEIPRMDWIFGVFFLFSPVINAWYLIWLLPFAVLRPSLWAWTASVVVSLSYAIGLHLVESGLGAYQINPYARTIELGLIALALAIDHRHRRFVMPRSDR